MNFLSIIGTGAGILNYRKAKQEYETIKGEIDSVEKAVYAATAEREEKEKEDRELQAELDQIKVDEVDNPQDLKISTICKVANLVGELARARVQLVISNVGKKTYYLTMPSVVCYVFDKPIVGTDVKVGERLVDKNGEEKEDVFDVPRELRYKIFVVRPGETKVIDFPKQIIYPDALEAGVMDKLRGIICEECDKRYITSCPKINIDKFLNREILKYRPLETANILFLWTTDANVGRYSGEENVKSLIKNNMYKTASYRGVPGVLRYCMELSLIGE